jgi:tetratricopeptide (TPR) repeat protein
MAHYNLGLIWSQTPGRLDEALAEFRESIRLKPDLVEAHDNLGDALLRTPSGLGDAIAEYREAIRLDPNAYRPHYNLAFVWSHLPGHIDDSHRRVRDRGAPPARFGSVAGQSRRRPSTRSRKARRGD